LIVSVTLADIQAASERIRPLAKRTPVWRSRGFDAVAGITAFFKCENFQTGGAFKIRGAANFLRLIPEADRARGVVAFSSGNHAQAVAIAARDLGVKATLVMPEDSPKVKLEATRAQGPEIVIYNRFTQDRAALGARIARETGATLVPPFDHPWIIAGQGTVALELLEEVPDLDAIVVPIGGGGLMAGCSVAAQALRPGIRVIGVEPEAANDAALSLEAGRRIEIAPPETIADGLRVPQLGELTFRIIQQNVERVVLVNDDELRAAVRWMLQRMKILAEPSGAAAVAAALFGKLPSGLGRVGLVVSGGNVDWDLLQSC
jgi:threonine dehydratase